MAKDQPIIKIKKVPAFPFPLTIKSAQPQLGSVVKLTMQGLMAEVTTGALRVGDKLDIEFELPVSHHFVDASCMVVKLYNQLTGGAVPGGKSVVLAEMHFKVLRSEHQEAVNSFLRTLQKAKLG